jgi:hypothetical protein
MSRTLGLLVVVCVPGALLIYGVIQLWRWRQQQVYRNGPTHCDQLRAWYAAEPHISPVRRGDRTAPG